MEIPRHLSHLQVDRRGIPVPCINLWDEGGKEDVDRWYMEYDQVVRRPALFMEERRPHWGEGGTDTPNFKRQCIQRQRYSAVMGHCQVCWKFLSPRDRWLVLSDMSLDMVEFQGVPVPTITEPWLCGPCMQFAVRTCPAIIRMASTSMAAPVHVTSKDQYALIASTGWVEGPLEELTKQVMPAMWVKIAIFGLPQQINEETHRQQSGLQVATQMPGR